MPNVRPELTAFAEAQERKLRANDHKGLWPVATVNDLGEFFSLMLEELLELEEALEDQDLAGIRDEAVDVANFALMLFDISGRSNGHE